jgi:hypothetical protein
MNTFVEADSETVSVSFYFYFVGNDYKMTFAFDKYSKKNSYIERPKKREWRRKNFISNL